MIVGVLQSAIGAVFVGADRTARFDVLVDDAFDSVDRHIRDRRDKQVAVARQGIIPAGGYWPVLTPSCPVACSV